MTDTADKIAADLESAVRVRHDLEYLEVRAGVLRTLLSAYREAVARAEEATSEMEFLKKLCRSEQEQLAATTMNLSDSERELAALKAQLAAANERLENNHFVADKDGELVRIDCEPGSIPDGIETRNETIKLQDERIKRLEAKLTTEPREAQIEAAYGALVGRRCFATLRREDIKDALIAARKVEG
jgi:chromosome segregation ATPase